MQPKRPNTKGKNNSPSDAQRGMSVQLAAIHPQPIIQVQTEEQRIRHRGKQGGPKILGNTVIFKHMHNGFSASLTKMALQSDVHSSGSKNGSDWNAIMMALSQIAFNFWDCWNFPDPTPIEVARKHSIHLNNS